MVALTHGTRTVENYFDLLGGDEDAITAAIAWTLARSPTLLRALLENLAGYKGPLEDATLHFQRSERTKGRTDLEILIPGALHLILEAKLGWELPTTHQLELYTKRDGFAASPGTRLIATLSQADLRYADLYLPKAVNGIPVRHLARRELMKLVTHAAASTRSLHEKQSLRELAHFLNKTMNRQTLDSNQVFVVSLSSNHLNPSWAGTTFIDVVERHRRYFHPVGNGWPKTPPNYIAFRYGGELRSIHHIEHAEVIMDLAKTAPGVLPVAPVEDPHFLYTLGPAMRPSKRVPAGPKVVRSNHVWAALDLLLTSATITEAMQETKKRQEP
jgi:hypothetical protein